MLQPKALLLTTVGLWEYLGPQESFSSHISDSTPSQPLHKKRAIRNATCPLAFLVRCSSARFFTYSSPTCLAESRQSKISAQLEKKRPLLSRSANTCTATNGFLN